MCTFLISFMSKYNFFILITILELFTIKSINFKIINSNLYLNKILNIKLAKTSQIFKNTITIFSSVCYYKYLHRWVAISSYSYFNFINYPLINFIDNFYQHKFNSGIYSKNMSMGTKYLKLHFSNYK